MITGGSVRMPLDTDGALLQGRADNDTLSADFDALMQGGDGDDLLTSGDGWQVTIGGGSVRTPLTAAEIRA